MYAVSKSCVKIDDTLSDFFPTQLGVKQGDNLIPNLFKIFINELPKYLKKSSDPVILNDKPIHCLMYADDIILLSTSAPGLQEKIGILGKFCDDWCLRHRPFNLKGGYGFLFRSEFFFRTTQELEYLFILSHKARKFFSRI